MPLHAPKPSPADVERKANEIAAAGERVRAAVACSADAFWEAYRLVSTHSPSNAESCQEQLSVLGTSVEDVLLAVEHDKRFRAMIGDASAMPEAVGR